MRADFRTRLTLTAAALTLAVIGPAAAGQTRPPRTAPAQQPRPAAPQPAPSADAEAITRRVCGTMCHPMEHATAIRRTRGQWEATVENMIGRGARGTSAELATIIDYLSTNHGLSAPPARGTSGPDDKPLVDPKASEMAKPLYAANCQSCHGSDARGTPQGPNLVRSLTVLHDRYGSTLGPFLRTQHPAAGAAKMAALTDTEVLLLAHFLRDRLNDTLRGAPMFKAGNVLTGDPKAGAEYFNGDGGCAQCHSPAGDLAGIGTRLEPINIQQRFLFPSNAARRQSSSGKVVTVTVTTESGETLTGELERMDDFNVSFRDATGTYRTVRRTAGTRVVKNDPFAAHVALLSRITDKNIHDIVAYLETLK